jgi:hypothetical protein
MSLRNALALTLAATLVFLPALAPAAASDASVEARLKARGTNFEVDDDGDYKIVIGFTAEKRTQLVFVSGKTESVAGFLVREVFSPAAFLGKSGIDGAKALELLADSRRQKIGAWEVSGDVLYYVIKLPDNVDAMQLDAAIRIAAELADDAEIGFSGDADEL